MKLSKHRQHPNIAFNMTPMIDIVFLLIIFFMTVSQITRVADHPLPLPRVTEGDRESKSASVTINVTEQGGLIVGGIQLTEVELEKALRQQLQRVDYQADQIKIQIRSDRNCECVHLSKLFQRLAELGFEQVSAAVTDS